MPRPPLSEAQLQAMRTRILDAALDILLKEGPHGLTSRAIARALGIAHMTLFTYFENQAALLAALAEREMAPIRTDQQRLERQAEDGDIVRVMRDALALYPRFAAEHSRLFQLAMAGPQLEGGSADRARARSQTHVTHLARLVQVGIARGTFHPHDPVLAASAVMGMVAMPLLLFATGRIASEDQRDALVAEMLEAALLYLTVPPAAAEAHGEHWNRQAGSRTTGERPLSPEVKPLHEPARRAVGQRRTGPDQ